MNTADDELRMRLALDAAGMGSFVWYPQEDRTEADARMHALLAVPVDQPITLASALTSLIHADDRARYAAAVERSLDPQGDGELREEVRFVYPDGSARWILVNGLTTFAGTPRRALRMGGVVSDVTAQRVADAAVRREGALAAFRVLLSDSLRGIDDPVELQRLAATVLAQHLELDRVFYAEVTERGRAYVVAAGHHSPALPSFAGRHLMTDFRDWLADLRAGHTAITAGSPAEGAMVVAPLAKGGRLQALLVAQQEQPREWAPHEVALIEETAERTWAAIERAHAEAELRRSERRLQLALEAAPMSWWEMDITTGVVASSGLFSRVFGIAPEDLPEETVGAVMEMVHPDDISLFVAANTRAATGQGDLSMEFRVVHPKTGEIIWVEAFGTLHHSPGDAGPRIVGVAKAITERKREEEALREREQAERQARQQAEIVASVGTAVESVPTVNERATRLVEVLVPQLAGAAAVVLPGSAPIVAPMEGPLQSWSRSWPMWIARDLTASLLVTDEFESAELTPEQRDAVLEAIAARAATLLGQAHLHEHEHQIAFRLQDALLPTVLARHPHLQLGASYVAASAQMSVGGDWYDAFETPDGAVVCVVGDVVGHGLDAAVAMGRLRTALVALAQQEQRPDRLLEALDRFASGPNGVEFATACVAVIDPASGELAYASAGHPPMLLVMPSGATEWLDGAGSPPLGGRFAATRRAATAVLPADAKLLLYSDGLVERRGEPITEGLDRLARLGPLVANGSAESACRQLLSELGTLNPRDDTALLVVRRTALPIRRTNDVWPADPSALRQVRGAVRTWLVDGGLSASVVADLVLGVGEACSNVVEHAYRGQGGDLIVDMEDDGDEVTLKIRDRGTWRADAPRDVSRGRGTGIMAAVTDVALRRTGPDGTTVTLIKRRGDEDRG